MSNRRNKDDDLRESFLNGTANGTSINDSASEALLDAPTEEDIGETTTLQMPTDISKANAPPVDKAAEARKTRLLLISFLIMLVAGTGNKIFQVLEFQPMYNYPLFVNMLSTFVYVPLSFAYIFPMIRYGTQITPEAQAVPKRVFAVMGLLDSIAGIMQSLAVNYIANGSLATLLTQAAIPISMWMSRWLLKTKYKLYQFVGALIVFAGLVVVLLPTFIHPEKSKGRDVPLWSVVLILSCIPMCLSSIYKERALGDTELDAVYLNGWVAVYQLLASIPLLLPSAPASNLSIKDIPENLWNGARCYVGINSESHKHGSVHKDDCAMAPIYVNVYLVFNIAYNILIILILKYGSANVLWLAMTIMVPIVNVAFSLKFMPDHKPLKWDDIVGLVLIMVGLIIYRFWGSIRKLIESKKGGKPKVVPASESINKQPPVPSAPTAPATPAAAPGTPGWSPTQADGVSSPALGGIGAHSHAGVSRVSKARAEREKRERERRGRYRTEGATQQSSRFAGPD